MTASRAELELTPVQVTDATGGAGDGEAAGEGEGTGEGDGTGEGETEAGLSMALGDGLEARLLGPAQASIKVTANSPAADRELMPTPERSGGQRGFAATFSS